MKRMLGNAFLWVGDRFFTLGFDWPTEVCYSAARALGVKLEWPRSGDGTTPR